MPDSEAERVLFDAFRADPERGAAEDAEREDRALLGDDRALRLRRLSRATPTWLESEEWLGSQRAARFPLALVANNPATRLHGQLDLGAYSQAGEGARARAGAHAPDRRRGARHRETATWCGCSTTAAAVSPARCVTTDVRPGVVQLSTGAWFDPDDPRAEIAMCVHGNPNVLTRDVGTSQLSQGCAGQHALVEVEKFAREAPELRAFTAPTLAARDS